MWNNLKASIASIVRTNNNQEITGANLQGVLNTIVNSVGTNATFVDVATTSTSPGTPDGPVFYIAAGKGIYPNFGNTEIEDGEIAVFLWNGTTWQYKKITISPDLDDEPTSGSVKAVKSGGVYAQIEKLRKRITPIDLCSYTNTSSNRVGCYASGNYTGTNFGGSPYKYFRSAKIDVTNIEKLRVKGYTNNTTGTYLVLRAEDAEGNFIASNSVIGDSTHGRKEFIWTKEEGTAYIRIFFNINYDYYCYEYPTLEDVAGMMPMTEEHEERLDAVDEELVMIDNRFANLTKANAILDAETFQTYSKTNQKPLRGDTGVPPSGSNYFGSKGVYYGVTTYIDVSDITSLEYNLPFPNKPTSIVGNSVALLAAYDANKVYLPENSVIVTAKTGTTNKGTWVRDTNTRYIRFTVYYNNGKGVYYAIDKTNLGNRLASIEQAIASLPSATDINDLNKDRDTAVANLGYYSNTLKLLHFSDLHYHPTNMQRIMDWYNLHADNIDDIINTGDTVNFWHGTSLGYGSVEGVEKILNTIGNHDIRSQNSATYNEYNGVPAYNKFIKPFITSIVDGETIDNWMVTQPSGAEANGYCYYYKDYTTPGIRLIVLDTIVSYTSGGHQQLWLEEVLSDAREQGLAVVVACHWLGVEKSALKTHFSKWSDGPSSGSASIVAADVQAFIDAGGEFCCYLIGHSHQDFIGTLKNYPNQLCLMVGAANGLDTKVTSNNYAIDHFGEVREIGTRSQDSFNIVGINKAQKTISVVKIGIDCNTYGQKTDFVVIDYQNMEEKFTNYDL